MLKHICHLGEIFILHKVSKEACVLQNYVCYMFEQFLMGLLDRDRTNNCRNNSGISIGLGIVLFIATDFFNFSKLFNSIRLMQP